MKRLVKAQAFIRGKQFGKAYKELGKYGSICFLCLQQAFVLLEQSDIPVKSIEAFLHLLDDSDGDFEEEKGNQKNRQRFVYIQCIVFL